MTGQFLMMWETLGNEDQNIDKFLNDETKNKDFEKALSSGSFINSHSYIQPYCDDPLDEELVSEEIYLTLIRKANHYIWISTPYLIITDEIRNELVSAAKKGVDVRIFVPGIPDKKIVNQCTKSYYGRLTVGGVKIFEYCPGFNHAKLCICDDRMALVGTANLDYRSLYHHFENGIVIYNNSVITDIKNDMEHMADVSRQITLSNLIAVPKWKKAARMLIRLCAPML
jgi:cardiolipin synthase